MTSKYILLIDPSSLEQYDDAFTSLVDNLISTGSLYPIQCQKEGFHNRLYIIRSDEYPQVILEALAKNAPKCVYYFYSSDFAYSSEESGYIFPELKDADSKVLDLCKRVSRVGSFKDLTDWPIYKTEQLPLIALTSESHKKYLPTTKTRWYPPIDEEDKFTDYFTKFYEENGEFSNLFSGFNDSEELKHAKETGIKLRKLVNMQKGEMPEFIVFEDADKEYNVAVATSMIVGISPIESEAEDTVEIILVNGLRYKANVDSIVAKLKYT